MNKFSHSLRSVIFLSIWRGLFYTLITCLFATIYFVSIFIAHSEKSNTIEYSGLYLLLDTVLAMVSIPLAFLFIGIPIIILPTLLGSLTLALLLHHDWINNNLSIIKGKRKGIGVGFFLGTTMLLIPNYFIGWKIPLWTLLGILKEILPNDILQSLFFGGFIIVPPLIGTIAGYLLGSFLSNNLLSNSRVTPLT